MGDWMEEGQGGGGAISVDLRRRADENGAEAPLSFWTSEHMEDKNRVKHRESAGSDSHTQRIHYPLLRFPEWHILLSNTEFMTTQSQLRRPDNGTVKGKKKRKGAIDGQILGSLFTCRLYVIRTHYSGVYRPRRGHEEENKRSTET